MIGPSIYPCGKGGHLLDLLFILLVLFVMVEHSGYVMYYGMCCWVEAIMAHKVLVRKFG